MSQQAWVQSQPGAVGAQPTKLFMLPFQEGQEMSTWENLEKVNCGDLDVTLAVPLGTKLLPTTGSRTEVTDTNARVMNTHFLYNKVRLFFVDLLHNVNMTFTTLSHLS